MAFWGYYKIFNTDITIGVNNIGDQQGLDIKKEEDMSQAELDAYSERWFMEASYYDNSNKNGIALQEVNFNYFQDWTLLSNVYRSTGMQYLGDYKHEIKTYKSEAEINNMLHNDFFYYDTTNGISWQGAKGNHGSIGTKLNRNEQLIIKIDNRPFAIQMTGKTDYYKDARFLGFLWKTGGKTLDYTVFHTYPMLFDQVFMAIKSNSKGYGNYYITLDLSSYFSIRELDSDGKFKADNVTDIIKNYAVLKFRYNPNGARTSSQSMFGIIECNSKYDLDPPGFDTTYWQERVVYTLTEKDLSYRYSATYDGYFASLSLDMKKMFETMPRRKVKIHINLDSAYYSGNGINLIGFDYNAFENFEIDTLRIVGSGTVHLLDKCLYGTRLGTLERSAGISLVFGSNVIETSYAEVII